MLNNDRNRSQEQHSLRLRHVRWMALSTALKNTTTFYSSDAGMSVCSFLCYHKKTPHDDAERKTH